jgi:hypothetical protein
MAFRIHDSVVRGEIDNRVKGIVHGRIWIHRRKTPVLLELQGNACPDLAGCLLTFSNPLKRVSHQHLDSLNPIQRGIIGDLTASRKVRVFDMPVEEAYLMCKQGKKPPEHMANCLYLEWYSEQNGRVVIESVDYQMTISAPQWRMTPQENEERAHQSSAGMNWFMQRLTQAIDDQKRGQKVPEEKWDEHDYEKFLKESDARTDKYSALIDKYGDSEAAEEKIAREMGWLREKTPEEMEEENQRIEEMNCACEEALNTPAPEPDPKREGIDWIRNKHGDIVHPLQQRCSQSALKFWKQIKKLGEKKFEDRHIGEFIFEFQTTAAKLAGTLNGIARGNDFADAAFTVACLKRSLNHLHKSQAGLEKVAAKKRLPHKLVTSARKELFQIREAILKLMVEYRKRD